MKIDDAAIGTAAIRIAGMTLFSGTRDGSMP